jgi:hypothetical protein
MVVVVEGEEDMRVRPGTMELRKQLPCCHNIILPSVRIPVSAPPGSAANIVQLLPRAIVNDLGGFLMCIPRLHLTITSKTPRWAKGDHNTSAQLPLHYSPIMKTTIIIPFHQENFLQWRCNDIQLLHLQKQIFLPHRSSIIDRRVFRPPVLEDHRSRNQGPRNPLNLKSGW